MNAWYGAAAAVLLVCLAIGLGLLYDDEHDDRHGGYVDLTGRRPKR